MPVLMKILDAVRVDALREIANIGTGHAVTALSDMTGSGFIMSVPAVGVQAMDRFADVLGDPEALAVAIYMPVDGDVSGHAAFLLPFAGACELTDLLLGLPVGETTDMDEMACSALTEIGNILIGSFLNALNEMTGLSFPVDPPGIAMDMTGAILQSIATASPALGDHALTVVTQMTHRALPIVGVFVYIPEPAALPVLFQALGL